jgi:alcohol dehydrogenase class IV
MLIGSLHAGMAFANSSVALVHGMARPIGAYFHVPHGVSNAALLPTVIEFSILGNPKKYADIAEAMGEGTAGVSMLDKAYLAAKAVIALQNVERLMPAELRQKLASDLVSSLTKAADEASSPTEM